MTFHRLLPFGLLVATVSCDADKISRLEKENRELAAKLDAASKAATLELQKKCADQAATVFKGDGLNWTLHHLQHSYTNHYQQRLKRCFVQISTSDGVSTSTTIKDAFEGKEYARFYLVKPEGRPSPCQVMLLSGEQKTCRSKKEFEELVKVYMEQ